MTISTTTSTITYAGNGATTAFTIPWLWYLDGDITVQTIVVSTGVITTLVSGVDYTLSGAGVGTGTCNCTTAPASLTNITIYLNPAQTQPSHYVANAEFPSATLEENFDREVQMVQRLQAQVSNALRFPDAESGGTSTLPAASIRASKYPVFDSSGNITISDGTGTDAGLRSDLANGVANLVDGAVLKGNVLSTLFKYDQTAAELAAGVTPANFNIPSNDAIGVAINTRYSTLSDALKVLSRTWMTTTNITPTSKLILQANGYGLVGMGQYTSILTAPNSLNDFVLNTNSMSAFLLQDFKITGNSAGNTSSKGLNVNNSYYCRITGVDVRDCNSDAITYTNSNSIVATNVQVHSTSGNGWVIDATSQKNTFNGCGAEDWSGYGFKISGIANILNAPWIENRSSATAATDIGILVNNRDNIINCPEIRGAASFALGTGIQLGASSTGCIVNNPHFSNCTINIETLGTNLYRSIIGATDADVTNTGGDTTTYIRKGNVVYSNQSWISTAPVLTFQSTNNASGVVFNRTGTATRDYRWQISGTTALEFTSNVLKGGTDATQSLGSSTTRWVNGYFSSYIKTSGKLVSALTAAATAGAGARDFVTDATATTFASIVAGSGTNGVPVYSDGTNWRIG